LKEPVVSVGLPVYNGKKFLRAAVESILGQQFGDFELIISDNASDDGTSAICEEYARADTRVRYSRLAANIGAIPNFQRVFRESRGKYFKWAAYDDICLPGFLERCVSVLERAPESAVLAYPRAERIDEAGRSAGPDNESLSRSDRRPHRRAAHVLMNVNLGWAQFGLIRHTALQRTSLHGSYIGSDYVLLAELAMLGEFLEIPEVLFQTRVHPGMSNRAHRDDRRWMVWLDPRNAQRRSFIPPVVRVGLECMKSAGRLALPVTERVLCQLWLPSAWYYRKLHDLGGRWKRRVTSGLGI
jgi:glycosyltransferase involved in cell wall biosynthesis